MQADRFSDVTVLKVSSKSLTLVSKLLRCLKERYGDCLLSQSSVLVNEDKRVYFAYLNLRNDKLTQQLLEITPYPDGAATP